MKIKINTLYSPMLNEDGGRYGTTRITFPSTEIETNNFTHLSGNLGEEIRNYEKEGSPRLCFEEEVPENWGQSDDIWNQESEYEASSFEDALEYYYQE